MRSVTLNKKLLLGFKKYFCSSMSITVYYVYWSERSDNRITKQLRDESQTYPDGIRFNRGLLNKPRSSIWFTNKCKNNSLVNRLRFVFLTIKEPVHKSNLLMKPTTLGALGATILHSLVKDAFFCHYFPLRCHRRGWKVAHETLFTFIFYSVIILGWHGFFLELCGATPIDPPLVTALPLLEECRRFRHIQR